MPRYECTVIETRRVKVSCVVDAANAAEARAKAKDGNTESSEDQYDLSVDDRTVTHVEKEYDPADGPESED